MIDHLYMEHEALLQIPKSLFKMAKKKHSKKLSHCEEKAIVTLEAKRITEKEQKQKQREKRKRENEATGTNKRMVLGGQVLPYQTGIQANVPVTTYESYPAEVRQTFEERYLRPAAAQAPAALQAYLFMNSGQHENANRVRNQAVRDQAVQAGGNRVGGNNNVNLLNSPSANVSDLRSNLERNAPASWFYNQNENLDRTEYDTAFNTKIKTKETGKKAAKEAAKQAKQAERAKRINEYLAGKATKAAAALAKGKKLTVEQFGDLYRGTGALGDSLLDSVVGGFNKAGEKISSALDYVSEAFKSKKKKYEGMNKIELDSLVGGDNGSNMLSNISENTLRKRKSGAGIGFSSLLQENQNNFNEEKSSSVNMDNLPIRIKPSDLKNNKKARDELMEQIINSEAVGKSYYNSNVSAPEDVRMTKMNKKLVSLNSKKWGLNEKGYIVDKSLGQFLHPEYENLGIEPPLGFYHYNEDAFKRVNKNVSNILNLPQDEEWSGLPPTPARDQPNQTQPIPDAAVGEQRQEESKQQEQRIDEYQDEYDNFNMNQSREMDYASEFNMDVNFNME